MSLFGRIFLLNAVALVAAAAVLVLGPMTVSAPAALTETLILTAGLGVLLVANAALIRLGLAPLDRLTRAMTTIDLLKPGPRLTAAGHGEIAELITTFNGMLDRLEAERGFSSARALSAQEAERRRVAQELHDEVRRIARRLRPGVLEELGLVSALKALVAEFSDHVVRLSFDRDLPELDKETELVVYRVAQEGLTNTVRHAEAQQVDVLLRSTSAGVELCVRDDGRGMGGAEEGAGIRGMRERALLIGAELAVGPAPRHGTEVRLVVRGRR
ncbi:HAMP domain-containing protein [Umezawaea sp. NPDC059074]|uniref:sensor histidine kinase n=1 Tax=Umezawaea sp. NPDC059074 TaxID=3346716 RepID=UPI0036CB679F